MRLIVRVVFFFKQKTAYDVRISDWSSDVCSSDLERRAACRTEAQHLMKRLSAVRSGTDADALAVQDCRYIVGMGAGRGKRQDRTGLFGIAKDGDARNSRESGPRVATKRGLVGPATRTSPTLEIFERSATSTRLQNWGRSGYE